MIQIIRLGPQNDFEIRLCKENCSNDTLYFKPLTNKQWFQLHEKYKKAYSK